MTRNFKFFHPSENDSIFAVPFLSKSMEGISRDLISGWANMVIFSSSENAIPSSNVSIGFNASNVFFLKIIFISFSYQVDNHHKPATDIYIVYFFWYPESLDELYNPWTRYIFYSLDFPVHLPVLGTCYFVEHLKIHWWVYILYTICTTGVWTKHTNLFKSNYMA